MQINSREYWKQRFESDWDELGGPAQTAFFTRLALDAMPDWFVLQVRGTDLSLCDWGCAEGAGTAMLAEALRAEIVGIDFSEEAIGKARSRYPALDFRAVDLLEQDRDWIFDILFSSNTLEHFHRPWQTFDKLERHARRHMVLMLPFREIERHPEHFHGFDPQGLPLSRGEWMLTHAAIIDAARMPGSLWPGEQLLAIYSRRAEVERLGLSLATVRIDTPQLERYRYKAEDNRQAATEVRSLVSGEIGKRMGDMQQVLVGAISDDIRMSGEIGSRVGEMSGEIGKRIGDMQQALVGAISDDIRMSGEIGKRVGEMSGEIGKRIGDMQQALVGAIADDIRRMQEQCAELQRAGAESQRVAAQTQTELMAELARRQVQADWQAARIAEQQAELASMQLAAAELVRSRDALRDVHETVLRSRTWRWTRPLRFAARLLRGGLDRSDREKLALFRRRLLRSESARRAVAHPLPVPAGTARGPEGLLPLASLRAADISPAAARDKPDVYVWAVIDWHFRMQRPQHLATALRDAGHRVFYISNNFVDAAEPGFSVEPLDHAGTLYQVHLNLAGAPSIYHALPAPEHAGQLDAGLRLLLEWNACKQSISIVHHPYWSAIAEKLPRVRLVYDCMDHHAGFADNAPQMAVEESRLMRRSDLVVVTSSWLEREALLQARHVATVRNAGDFEMFSRRPRDVFADPESRKVIGYYGAIADWFDEQLVRAVALAHPDALVVLVGSDTGGVADKLAGLPNVRMVGEVKYDELPYWLHGFDVCLLPFRVRPLTLATNPVKVYEYLAAGKPVVAVDLPEMAQFAGHVARAGDAAAFVSAVGDALRSGGGGPAADARRQFAAGQTWRHRAEEMETAMAAVSVPRASVVVVTYNNLEYTRACLASLERNNDWTDTEMVVVDNASSDGTREFLEKWQGADPTRKVLFNDENRGFAAANNQGIEASSGDFLVLLNNDTFVTRGWMRGLLDALQRDDACGMAGPVTNNIGNEAKIDIQYGNMDEMSAAAARFTSRHRCQTFEMRTLAFFCVAMRRSTFDAVGPLDEQFGMGFFEDDDYCRRVEALGLRNVCVEDVFVHHHLSASFNRIDQAKRKELFERNKDLYERKWGAWTPHGNRALSRPELQSRS